MAGEVPSRRQLSRCGVALALAVVVHAAAARTVHAADDARDAEIARLLDRLVAEARPDGGWTFSRGPHGERPSPFTTVMQVAERVAAPFGLATWDLVVLRSPGTPAAGLALLEGWRRTGDQRWLDAARRGGDLLLALQLASGGWFSEMPAHGAHLARWFPWLSPRVTLDDDVTPGAARFLLALWQATGTTRYRDAAERAVSLLLAAQLPSGAWPHGWRPWWLRAVRSSREDRPSLNDGVTPIAIETLLAAAAALDRPSLVDAAVRGGDWLVAVQARGARAGWAQQYDADGAPAAMRVFEPAALASWETRHAIDALDALARSTGDRRWCAPAAAAAAWLASARVGAACWARLYDLVDGAPVYVAADGSRVPLAAARPGYDWVGEFGVTAALWRFARWPDPAPPAPVAGDPGACADVPSPTPRGGGGGARLDVADVALLLAATSAPSRSPCVVAAPPVR